MVHLRSVFSFLGLKVNFEVSFNIQHVRKVRESGRKLVSVAARKGGHLFVPLTLYVQRSTEEDVMMQMW